MRRPDYTLNCEEPPIRIPVAAEDLVSRPTEQALVVT
jgi:hypothetical protein